MRSKSRFSQRHPLLFGLGLMILAVALVLGVTAFFRSPSGTSGGGSVLAVAYLEGLIADAEEMVEYLGELQDDPAVRGVVLRINSPGGSIAPSQELYRAVRDLAKTKPVVASFNVVAASGGYYAAAPATLIMSNPGSITGSIGVKVEYLDLHQLLESWGVRQEQLTSGENKGAGSPFRELTDEQRAYLMSMVMDMHDQFVTDVAKARSMRKDVVAALADGRAYTGRQALKLGLVDELGGLSEALDRLAELAGVSRNADVIYGPPEDVPLLRELMGEATSGVKDALGQSGWRFEYR